MLKIEIVFLGRGKKTSFKIKKMVKKDSHCFSIKKKMSKINSKQRDQNSENANKRFKIRGQPKKKMQEYLSFKKKQKQQNNVSNKKKNWHLFFKQLSLFKFFLFNKERIGQKIFFF